MKKWLGYGILCLLIPAVVLGGALIFRDRQYAYITLCVAVLSCLPFFLHFERSANDVKRLILIAVMVALSVAGRMLFAPLQHFKPVTALVIITAMYFGSEAGFMTGALSAVISNFYFGQGPWTPFQMLSWGLLGFIAGLIADPLRRSRVVLAIYAVISGVLYSLLMDIWSTLWSDGYFNVSRYLAFVVSSAQFTLIYAVSNLVFLLLLARPIGKILCRIKTKYGIRTGG